MKRVGVRLDVLERARQQVSGRDVGGNQWMDGGAIACRAGSQLTCSCPLAPPCAASIAASSSGSASSISRSVMTNGGSSRIDRVGRPVDQQLPLAAPPARRARPDDPARLPTSGRRRARRLTAGWRVAIARSPASRCAPTRATFCIRPPLDQLVDEHQRRAAGEQVAAVGAAVIAGLHRRRDLSRHQRRANRNAGAERLAERHQVRLQAKRRRVERHARFARDRTALRRR